MFIYLFIDPFIWVGGTRHDTLGVRACQKKAKNPTGNLFNLPVSQNTWKYGEKIARIKEIKLNKICWCYQIHVLIYITLLFLNCSCFCKIPQKPTFFLGKKQFVYFKFKALCQTTWVKITIPSYITVTVFWFPKRSHVFRCRLSEKNS